MRPATLFAIIWTGWAISWVLAAFYSNRAEKHLASRQIWVFRASIVVGVLLLSHFAARRLGERRIWHVGYGGAYILAGLTLAGILFTWWGRIHLGRLWSSAIARQRGHHVVDTGPYSLVRHPIYSGLIFATVATAVAKATISALVGCTLIGFGLWLKATLEEGFLADELEPGTYAAYRRRVSMLVPFL
jgi:protein-S-isoprenylcysteine O-methyltransferase Ste14